MMYVSDDYRYAMIHIQKTGGTTIARNLGKRTEGKRILYRHSYLSEVTDELEKRIRKYFIFAFVRNPYHRIVSRYRFHLVVKPLCSKDPKYKNLERFIKFFGDLGKLDGQSQYVTHPRLKCNIFKFENIQEDYDKICKKLKVDRMVLPKLKQGHFYGNYTPEKYLTFKAIGMINDLYADDFKNFGYKMRTK
jgi:hypothetical protein